MSRINIPLDALTSRLNLGGRFDSVRSQSIANRFANLKPVSEFLDIKRISKPRDFGELQSRANYNLSYFSSNYALVFVMLSIYSLLNNPLLLFVIVLVVGGMFGISKLQGADLDLGFARFTSSQLYTGLLVVSVPLGLWASPIATALWLVGASAVTILGHAILMDKPIEASFSEYVAHTIISSMADTNAPAERRFKDRSAAHSSPYETGRPPGALSDRSRRARYFEDWELREQQLQPRALRFQELESEDEDQGVLLDSRQKGFRGDELYFDGYDLGQDGQRRRQGYEYADVLGSEEETMRQGYLGRRNSDEDLVIAALEAIARARAKGKTNVNLSAEEMEALERRHLGQPPPPPPRAQALISPPSTPAKTAKTKTSRSSSAASLASQKTKKKSSLSSPSPAKSNSKAKVDRAAEQPPYPSGSPGIMVPGPNGVSVFAPLVNYPGPPSPEQSRTRSQSISKHSRRESTPPERADPYGRFYIPQPANGLRPQSSGSYRIVPAEDADGYPPDARASSYAHPYDYYDTACPPAMPAAQGRRSASGPPAAADVRYASLRRVPPSSSPLASGRRGSGMQRSGSSSSEDQGVQVNIFPDAGGNGYSVSRAPVPAPVPVPIKEDGGRRRKSGRR